MNRMIQSPKGTKDLLPEGSPGLDPTFSVRFHQYVIDQAQSNLERVGAKYIQTPMFEYPEVIQRGVGAATDIVQKEMFSVSNDHASKGESKVFILRPEGTAPLARAYIQNGLKQFPAPLKLWTHGPMFRAENVQEGRYRQFHQIGYEVFGASEPLIDAEAMASMWDILQDLGLRDVEFYIGSVGSREDRHRYNDHLRETLLPHKHLLSVESQSRLEVNPLRIWDSKDERDRHLLVSLGISPLLDFLSGPSKSHFEDVQSYLDLFEIPYTIDPMLVRGLDYYEHTAWEIHHKTMGGKTALGGGGRYNGLVELLGGLPVPGVGWALGVERVVKAVLAEGVALPEQEKPLLYMGALDDDSVPNVASLARKARKFAWVEYAYKPKAIKKHIQDAVKKGARFVAFMGSEEREQGTVTYKALESGEQWTLSQEEFLSAMEGVQ